MIIDRSSVRSLPGQALGTAGAVYVEFLIAFMPVLVMFLCLLQLAFLFAVRVTVEHAALNAARTAAVVIGDDPKEYNNERVHEVRDRGARAAVVRRSAILTLAPFIVDGTISRVDVAYGPNNVPGGAGRTSATYAPLKMNDAIDKVRVQLSVTATCKIMLANRIACGNVLSNAILPGRPTRTMHAEAMYPYQGARYTYP